MYYIFYSLLRLIACVTQLNLITFVGLAEWIAETNNYHFNTEKNTWKNSIERSTKKATK